MQSKLAIMEKQFNYQLPMRALFDKQSHSCTTNFVCSFIDPSLVNDSTTFHDMCVIAYNRKKAAYTFVGDLVLKIIKVLQNESIVYNKINFQNSTDVWMTLDNGTEAYIAVSRTEPPNVNNKNMQYHELVVEIGYRLNGAKLELTRLYTGYVTHDAQYNDLSTTVFPKYAMDKNGLITELKHYADALLCYGPEKGNHRVLYHHIYGAFMYPYMFHQYDTDLYMCLPYDEIDTTVLDDMTYINSTDKDEIACIEFNHHMMGRDNTAIFTSIIGSTGPAFREHVEGYEHFSSVSPGFVMFAYEQVLHIMECTK